MAAGPRQVDEALGQLADASLLTFSVDDSTVGAHRLIMRVARERLRPRRHPGRPRHAGLRPAVGGHRVAGEPWQNRAAARDAIQQVIALHEHLAPYLADRHRSWPGTLLRLRGWALWCMNDLGDSFAQAIEYGWTLVADCERLLGETHPDTLTSRNNLARAYQDAGRLERGHPAVRADPRRLASGCSATPTPTP